LFAFLRLPTALPLLADNVPAALRSWGGNCTPFGLSPTVNRNTAAWVITSTPNFAKPLVSGWLFLRSFVSFLFTLLARF
jgi:hypothetical protein